MHPSPFSLDKGLTQYEWPWPISCATYSSASFCGLFHGSLCICPPYTRQQYNWQTRWLKDTGAAFLRIHFKLNTALLFYCPCVRPCSTGVTSYISHIYKGINAMLIIKGPIKPYIFWIKIILAIFLAKTRPDKTIISALTNLTIIDFDFELSKI